MPENVCSVGVEYQSLGRAMECLEEMVQRDKRPYKAIHNYFVSGEYESITWNIVEDDNCKAGAEYNALYFEHNKISARSCAISLGIIENREYKAVMNQFNFFGQNFYKVVENNK